LSSHNHCFIPAEILRNILKSFTLEFYDDSCCHCVLKWSPVKTGKLVPWSLHLQSCIFGEYDGYERTWV